MKNMNIKVTKKLLLDSGWQRHPDVINVFTNPLYPKFRITIVGDTCYCNLSHKKMYLHNIKNIIHELYDNDMIINNTNMNFDLIMEYENS